MVELQIHGGVAVAGLVLRTLLQDGARMASAGEFTRRAFLNGKLTLAQAEGVAAVIEAQSQSALRVAYSLLTGSAKAQIDPILAKLDDLLVTLEAAFDYPDEMEDQVNTEFGPAIAQIEKDLQALAATAHNGKMARDGISVAIVGRPNAGKSSLLNCILREDRAIVTPIAGTTRDTICESVVIDGVRLNLLDTAGLRETTDTVEKIGVERAMDAASRADAVIYLLDATLQDRPDPKVLAALAGKVYVVYNKADLACVEGARAISAKTGQGVPQLLAEIASLCQVTATDSGVLGEERHLAGVRRALDEVQKARADFGQVPLDCTVLSLRAAYQALGEIDGSTATDAVVDGVFTRFCVGK